MVLLHPSFQTNVMNGHGGYRLRGKASVRAEGLQDESELRTDHNRWRLSDERGRQRWFYLKTKKEAEEWPQTTADRFHLGMPLVCKTESTLKQAHPALTKSPLNVGPAKDAACKDTSGSGGKRPFILRASSITTRQLGL